MGVISQPFAHHPLHAVLQHKNHRASHDSNMLHHQHDSVMTSKHLNYRASHDNNMLQQQHDALITSQRDNRQEQPNNNDDDIKLQSVIVITTGENVINSAFSKVTTAGVENVPPPTTIEHERRERFRCKK